MENISAFRRKKKERLDDILKTRENIDDTPIVKRIEEYWMDEIKGYQYMDDCQNLKKGKFIKYISLDLQDLKSGLIVNIEKTKSGYVKKLVLHILGKDWYWKIDPHKYYLYVNKSTTNNFLKELIEKMKKGELRLKKET